MTITSPFTKKAVFPDVPRNVPFLAKDTGNVSDNWVYFFDQLATALQDNLTPEGFLMPQQTAANISQLTSVNSLSAILYDKTNNAFDGNVAIVDTIAGTTTQQWIQFAMITDFAGNPNGNVAGVVNWLCYDTSGKHLYICTATGNATNATWQLV